MSTWAPPDRAGVHAILVPGQLGPDLVYFGESGDFSRLRKFRYDPKYPCWLEKAGSEEYGVRVAMEQDSALSAGLWRE